MSAPLSSFAKNTTNNRYPKTFMKKPALLICMIFCLGLVWNTEAAQDKDARPVFPANSNKAGYSQLDKLPDWRGLWFPVIGKVGGTEPVLIGEAKKTWDMQQARLAADPHYEVPETGNNCEPDG